ncbi:MAG: ABC transporter ATP-binding protein/permease [Lachnospiraceae bacterium]|nr:ABC transporter ATP-binding protein/permease [Lachnospiraceae bacterium]
MLSLQNIVKEYVSGDTKVQALKGISVDFRESEFVSILGQSGCGKTTTLNIIGGLDHYTSGDLIINGKSTKEFKDKDWDTYRNHSIGFVFQSYNLIPHQSVLANVEIALTLSGVSKGERRERAKEALRKVGLEDQLHKRPNQMSGGQMQRVAIARALVNDPDIILADEPTGALDTETSIQIMEILKEISKDKLIIMVTHNPELAEKYSSRIIRLLDGKIVDDSNPYKPEAEEKKAVKEDNKKKASMSFMTALSLSMNNLMTKKGRTILTAFAGSIGIIGIALILALSNGVQQYITKTEEEALSSYPISIQETTMDMSSMMSLMMGMNMNSDSKLNQEDNRIYSNNIVSNMIETMMEETKTNNLKAFKEFIEDESNGIKELTTDITYGYSTQLNIYNADTSEGIRQVNPSQVFNEIGLGGLMGTDGSDGASLMTSYSSASYSDMGVDVWSELSDNEAIITSNYEVIEGRLPSAYNEVVVAVDANNQISDYCLYALGVLDTDELMGIMQDVYAGNEVEKTEVTDYSYEDIMNLKFKLLLNTDYFEKENGVWVDKSKDTLYMKNKINDALELKVVGIVRPKDDSEVNETGSVFYSADLMKYLIEQINESEIVKEQQASPDIDVFTGLSFVTSEEEEQAEYTQEELEMAFQSLVESGSITAEELTQIQQEIGTMTAQGMDEETMMMQLVTAHPAISTLFVVEETNNTYDGNLDILGVASLDSPSSINIYPKDFEAKDSISDIIADYNNSVSEDDTISYTDYIGLMLSSVTTIINAISYILIGFVSISLIVSSIMIAIITYISVLERTKEIGILRAVGASKKDISRVFNAETLIEGFVSGVIGIGVSLLICIPINIVVENGFDIKGIANLPWQAGVILVLISMGLTFIAGLVPSRMASKKDPVVALRSE